MKWNSSQIYLPTNGGVRRRPYQIDVTASRLGLQAGEVFVAVKLLLVPSETTQSKSVHQRELEEY